jgi:hypothetical protein
VGTGFPIRSCAKNNLKRDGDPPRAIALECAGRSSSAVRVLSLGLSEARKRGHRDSVSRADLEEVIGQLIERVSHLHAQNDERSDHQIEAEMHEGLEPKADVRPTRRD